MYNSSFCLVVRWITDTSNFDEIFSGFQLIFDENIGFCIWYKLYCSTKDNWI